MIQLDDPREVRRLRRRDGSGLRDEGIQLRDRGHRVESALEADRRRAAAAHRDAAQRPGDVAGEHLDAVGQLHQPPERVEEPFRALRGTDGEIGARGVADEQGVSGEDEPWLVRARPVDHGETTVLGPVTGRVDAAKRDVADRDLVAVLERVVRVLGPGRGVNAHGHLVLEREPAVARDVVGVRVRLERPHDAHLEPFRLCEHLLDRVRRVDHDGLLRLLAADEVRGAPEIAVQDLREQHGARDGSNGCRYRS